MGIDQLRFLTPEFISSVFQIPIQQVQKLARKKEIPAIKVGRLWRFREEDILKWIEQSYSEPCQMSEIFARAKEIVDNHSRN